MIRHGCIIQLAVAVLTAVLLKLFFNHVGTDDNHVVQTDLKKATQENNKYQDLQSSIKTSKIISSSNGINRNMQVSISRTREIDKVKTANVEETVEKSSENVTTIESVLNSLKTYGSSVWCTGDNHTSRSCIFHNICFSSIHDTFMFYHSDHSVLQGIPGDRFNPALSDSSSIADHNALYFNYVDLPIDAINDLDMKDIEYVGFKSQLLGRVNGGNLMHLFHDELIPLFYLWSQYKNKHEYDNLNVQLFLFDKTDYKVFNDILTIFTGMEPIYRADMIKNNRITCFKEIHVGIPKNIGWYNFGLYEPQKPLSNTVMTGHILRQFTTFLKKSLGVPSKALFKNYILLLSRKDNRLILNEGELLVTIAREFNMKVLLASLSTHSLNDIIHLVSGAKGVIAMHGSLLILAMFLPKRSFVIELFPYAVDPINYTPYKTLCEIKGVDITYRSWVNKNLEATVTHPNNEKEFGGIQHLTPQQQMEITTQTSVPKHLCCNNPAWLFRIYQDTLVNITEVINILNDTMLSGGKSQTYDDRVLFPGPVNKIQCSDTKFALKGDLHLQISWSQPMNVKYLAYKDLRYEIWLQVDNQMEYKSWFSDINQIKIPVIERTKYNVWIRCLLDERVGPFNAHFQCST